MDYSRIDLISRNNSPVIKRSNIRRSENGTKGSFIKLIEEYSTKLGVNPSLAKAVAMKESGIRQDAVSKAGAIGIMQLMPETAASLGVNPNNAEQNIAGGIRYLRKMLDEFDDNTELALAAYNAGPGNVKKYGGIPPFDETQTYVKRIMGMIEDQGDGFVPGIEPVDSLTSTKGISDLLPSESAEDTIDEILETSETPQDAARRILARTAYLGVRLLSSDENEG